MLEKRIHKEVEDVINKIENDKIKKFKDKCPNCYKKIKRKNFYFIAQLFMMEKD